MWGGDAGSDFVSPSTATEKIEHNEENDTGHETQDAEDSNLADYLLPDREELERVTPKIEQELESMWDVEEKVFR